MKKSFLFLLLSCSFLNAATPIKNISEIATGIYFILLLKQNKNVLALGDNTYGELGNGESGADLIEENPVTVVSPSKIGVLTNIKAIAGGEIHSLALGNSGMVYSWGGNYSGQLGDNTNNNSDIPVLVVDLNGSASLTSIKAIATGGYHSLALDNSGMVYSWGNNSFSQLGDNTNNDSNKPVQVVAAKGSDSNDYLLTDIKAIAGGYLHSLSLDDNGKVFSWGYNGFGQLGDNTDDTSNIPVQVVAAEGSDSDDDLLTDIKSIAGGLYHSLALHDNGNVYSWGWNYYGQLGNGNNSNSNKPVQVVAEEGSDSDDDLLTDIKLIAGGYSHSLALHNNGSVYSWGNNEYGQLGIGSEIQKSSTPILIESLDSIIAISANNNYSLALKNDGTVWFWGVLFNGIFIKQSKVPIQLTEEMMQYIPKEFFSPKVFY